MALPSSGTISLAEIQAEFGGPTNPIKLSNYYRGGAYVTTNNTSIPTSGTLSIPSQFYGAVKFGGSTDTYTTAGSGTETVPSGASTVVIEVWGAGGGGRNGIGTGMGAEPGYGGGAGGYVRTSMSVTAGKTFAYTVGTGGANGSGTGSAGSASSVSSGTQTLTTMTGNGGAGSNAGSGGSGGTATGGTIANTSGGAGGNPAGGTAVTGAYGDTYGGGGHGGTNGTGTAGVAGSNGAVQFTYS